MPMGTDEVCFRYVYAGPGAHGAVFAVMVATTILGGGWGALMFLPFLYRAKTRRMTSALFLSFLVAATIGTLIKFAVARVRPCYSLEGVHSLWGAPSGYSFPSGHATGSFCFAGFAIVVALRVAKNHPERKWQAWGAAVLAIVLATIVGLSRVYLGVHFPGDVSVGAILGLVVGFAGAVAFYK
ncbi:MAG TPA: phosphatase PAP2 family protein, partial [Polyangiaceae bacterium]